MPEGKTEQFARRLQKSAMRTGAAQIDTCPHDGGQP